MELCSDRAPGALTWLATLMLICGAPAHADEQLASRHLLASGLASPTNLTALPDGRVFVIEPYEGRIRVIQDGALQAEPFLALGDRLEEDPHVEGGLLGLAFAPDYAESRQFYVTYTSRTGALQLSRFSADPSGAKGQLETEEILLSISDRDYHWHNCGHIEFAQDGQLYMCIGDMDANGNPSDSAQELNTLKGKIFRIDPTDDELVPEIVGYGLRNPWRFTVLPSGALIVPDAGFESWEELNRLAPDTALPANFGWNRAEGNDCRRGECNGELIWPTYVYPHDGYQCAIIGGTVYRGAASPAWHGVYVFGDFCSGTVSAIRNLETDPEIRTLSDEFTQVTSVASDADGELIVADFGENGIYQLALPADFQTGWTSVSALVTRQALEMRRAGVHSSKNDLEKLLSSQRWKVARKMFNFYDHLVGAK